eukprot:gnl/Hemi2/12493_TR4258_c0_g1_i1.p1 gnl/Hemi2/12493_TR4258_c0_g1~~gnl/Hemi2/12493_TR4258_c0_g1_i1.p1  ORF type:complete len:259 (-),score=34.77 gnl/Hemi2/12493_TR4258_c0_g1_i1:156-932(-)
MHRRGQQLRLRRRTSKSKIHLPSHRRKSSQSDSSRHNSESDCTASESETIEEDLAVEKVAVPTVLHRKTSSLTIALKEGDLTPPPYSKRSDSFCYGGTASVSSEVLDIITLTVYVPYGEPLQLSVAAACLVSTAIERLLRLHASEGRFPTLRPDAAAYDMRVVDDDDLPDYDMPVLDRDSTIGNVVGVVGDTRLALCAKRDLQEACRRDSELDCIDDHLPSVLEDALIEKGPDKPKRMVDFNLCQRVFKRCLLMLCLG